MIEQINGRYVNRYAELDKPFIVKGSSVYTSRKNGVSYESIVLTQGKADFNFAVSDTEIASLKNFIGKEVFISCVYNPFGKYSFQQIFINSFEPVPTSSK